MLKELLKTFRSPIRSKDGSWSWLLVFLTFWLTGMTWGFLLTIGIFYSEWLVEFKESRAKTAWLATLATSVLAMASPIVGVFCGKFGTRRVTLLGSLIYSISLILTSIPDNLNIMLITFTGFGIGCSFMSFPSTQSVSHYFERWFSFAAGIATAGFCVFPIVISPVVELAIQRFGWRVTLRIFAIGFGSVGLFSSLFFRTVAENENVKGIDTKDEKNDNWKTIYLGLLRSRLFQLILLQTFLWAPEVLVSSVHQVQFAKDIGVPDDKTALLPSVMGAGNLIGRLFFPFLVSWKRLRALPLFQGLLFFSGITSLIGYLSENFYHLLIYDLIYTTFDGGWMGLTYSVYYELFGPFMTPYVTAVVYGLEGIAMLVGPPVVGWIVDKTGNGRSMFFMLAIPLISASLFTFFITCSPEYQRKQKEQSCNYSIQIEKNNGNTPDKSKNMYVVYQMVSGV